MKLLRERAGLSRAEFGRQVGYGEDQITSVELGRRIPKPELIDKADEVLDASGVLKAMKGEVERARYPTFFRHAARLESDAVELHVYSCQAVPGLLQTEEYARAVFTMMRPPLDEEAIDQRVAARLARQAVFGRRPPPMVSFVIDESCLRRPIGGEPILRGQLEQILLVAQRRTVEVQVMPLRSRENAGLAGPFTLMETKEGRRIAYAEVQNVSHVHTERPLVRGLEAKYGLLRAQALTPGASLTYIENLLGEL
ncbi:helix-turn-helix domain-containing protein [Streptomyces aidingensis]|nr:helix-turn-helix transcriptional regulator [Streptomyces aidingensis]